MRRTIIFISLLVLLLVPFLTSCEAGDLDVLVNYAKMWAMVHDITDEDGHVSYGAATRFIVGEAGGFGSTGDKEGDAVIDSARTVNKMREAQSEADQGTKDLYDGRDLDKDVLPHYNQAIKLRPNDWVYYNDRGIAYLEKWNDSDYQKNAASDFEQAAEVAGGNRSEVIKMYTHRANSLQTAIKHHSDVDHAVPKVFYTELSDSYGYLYAMTSDNQYKVLQNEADAKLQQYQ